MSSQIKHLSILATLLFFASGACKRAKKHPHQSGDQDINQEKISSTNVLSTINTKMYYDISEIKDQFSTEEFIYFSISNEALRSQKLKSKIAQIIPRVEGFKFGKKNDLVVVLDPHYVHQNTNHLKLTGSIAKAATASSEKVSDFGHAIYNVSRRNKSTIAMAGMQTINIPYIRWIFSDSEYLNNSTSSQAYRALQRNNFSYTDALYQFSDDLVKHHGVKLAVAAACLCVAPQAYRLSKEVMQEYSQIRAGKIFHRDLSELEINRYEGFSSAVKSTIATTAMKLSTNNLSHLSNSGIISDVRSALYDGAYSGANGVFTLSKEQIDSLSDDDIYLIIRGVYQGY